jgi:hypothetical protein
MVSCVFDLPDFIPSLTRMLRLPRFGCYWGCLLILTTSIGLLHRCKCSTAQEPQVGSQKVRIATTGVPRPRFDLSFGTTGMKRMAGSRHYLPLQASRN